MRILLTGAAGFIGSHIAPAGSQKAFHLEGEMAVARAARTKNHLQILSTVSSTAVEEVIYAHQFSSDLTP